MAPKTNLVLVGDAAAKGSRVNPQVTGHTMNSFRRIIVDCNGPANLKGLIAGPGPLGRAGRLMNDRDESFELT